MDKSLIESINSMQNEIANLKAQIEQLQAQMASKTNEVENAKATLLAQMRDEGLEDYHDEEHDLFVTMFNKVSIGYSSDSDVIAKLRGTEFAKFIRVKTTEALDKNPLKKEVKSNAKLNELLKPLIVENSTAYVTVTTRENHTKMLEHIEENAKKKGK